MQCTACHKSPCGIYTTADRRNIPNRVSYERRVHAQLARAQQAYASEQLHRTPRPSLVFNAHALILINSHSLTNKMTCDKTVAVSLTTQTCDEKLREVLLFRTTRTTSVTRSQLSGPDRWCRASHQKWAREADFNAHGPEGTA